MAITQPTWHGPLVNPDGTLSQPLVRLLQALASGTASASDAAALSALGLRVSALEAQDSVQLFQGEGITISGSAESGYLISSAGGTTDVLAAQVFGS
jgi:hypothetical protein